MVDALSVLQSGLQGVTGEETTSSEHEQQHEASSLRALRFVATYLSVQRRARVLFNSEDVQVKCRLQLGVCYVGLLESETSWADESFVLWRFPCEAFADEGDLRRDNHAKIERVLPQQMVNL